MDFLEPLCLTSTPATGGVEAFSEFHAATMALRLVQTSPERGTLVDEMSQQLTLEPPLLLRAASTAS